MKKKEVEQLQITGQRAIQHVLPAYIYKGNSFCHSTTHGLNTCAFNYNKYCLVLVLVVHGVVVVVGVSGLVRTWRVVWNPRAKAVWCDTLIVVGKLQRAAQRHVFRSWKPPSASKSPSLACITNEHSHLVFNWLTNLDIAVSVSFFFFFRKDTSYFHAQPSGKLRQALPSKTWPYKRMRTGKGTQRTNAMECFQLNPPLP